MSTSAPPSLPAPDTTDGTNEQAVKLDALGPIVVNSDGTLSRISNWENMTPVEREHTVRIIAARNKLRLANEEERLRAISSGSTEGRAATPPE